MEWLSKLLGHIVIRPEPEIHVVPAFEPLVRSNPDFVTLAPVLDRELIQAAWDAAGWKPETMATLNALAEFAEQEVKDRALYSFVTNNVSGADNYFDLSTRVLNTISLLVGIGGDCEYKRPAGTDTETTNYRNLSVLEHANRASANGSEDLKGAIFHAAGLKVQDIIRLPVQSPPTEPDF